MISDEIQRLRAQGKTDGEIAGLIAAKPSIEITASEISENYAPPKRVIRLIGKIDSRAALTVNSDYIRSSPLYRDYGMLPVSKLPEGSEWTYKIKLDG